MEGGLSRTIALVLAGVASVLVFAAPATAAIEPVTNLHVTEIGPATISVAWDPPTSQHTYFAIWVLGPAPGGGAFPTSPTGGAARTSMDLGGLVCASSYTVEVAWQDDLSQQPEPSAAVTTATAACTRPPPAAPSGLRASATDTDIVFTWDDQPFAVSARATLSGPGIALNGGGYGATRLDPRTVVCGETYTLVVYWIDDEGLRSPDATFTASALECPPPADPGPLLRVASSSWNTLTYAWAAYGAPGLWMVRTTTTGGPPYRYLEKSTLSQLFVKRACGTAYPFTVQWVFTDGTVSGASTLAASTDPCLLAAVTTGDPTSVQTRQAVLSGTVITNGSDTVYHFDYGTTPDYGSSSSPQTTSDHGSELRRVSSVALDLTPATTYHYRLATTNAAGTSYGADRTFNTSAAPAIITPTPRSTTPTPVAQPPARCTVPRVKGVSLRAAKVKLTRAHCSLGKITRRHSARSRRGKVLASKPAAGARTSGKVTLVVGR